MSTFLSYVLYLVRHEMCIRDRGKGGIILYQIGEFIVKAENGVCEVKDLVHLDFSDTDSKKLYYHQQ